ncbi:MAG: hypothetical protein J1F16_04960 [Muribaculaceae bacterium]|nr:hypothetical protein [Muribaculaceae bacterium]
MELLKDLLEKTDIKDLDKEGINLRFQEIAETLMGNYIIKKGEKKKYAIVEIEFYLYTPSHQDFITYPRDLEAGRWFFHKSGVDITFKSQDVEVTIKDKKEIYNAKNGILGGILIRGLYDLTPKDQESKKEDRYIFGPLKCVDLLWDNFDAFQNSKEEYPVLTSFSEGISLDNMVKCKRCINIEENHEIKVVEWAERLGFNKDDNIEEKKIYCKKLFDQDIHEYHYRFFNLITGHNPQTFTKIQPPAARPLKIFPVKK